MANAEEALKVIKSILISSKDPLSISLLQRDYHELTGKSITYNQFGYDSLENFLRAHPMYVSVFFARGMIQAQAPQTEETRHISKLVQGQRRSKSSSFTNKTVQPIRRPRTANWNPPPRLHKAHFYTKKEAPPKPFKYLPPHKRNPHSCKPELPPLQPLLPNTVATERPHQNHQPNEYLRLEGPHHNYQPNEYLRPQRPHPNHQPNGYLGLERPQQNHQPNEYLRPQRPHQNHQLNEYSRPERPNKNHQPYESLRPEVPQYVQPPKNYPQQMKPYEKYKQPGVKPKSIQPESKSAPISKPLSYMQQLELLEPSFVRSVVTAGKRHSYYLASVQVKGKIYSCYPQELPTSNEALEAAAKKALEDLNAAPVKQKSTMAETKEFNIAYERVKKMLQNNKTGLWWEALTKEYSQAYSETLGKWWLQEARDSCDDILFQAIDDKRIILRPKETIDIKPKKRLEPPTCILPSDGYWGVHVFYIKDCSSVSMRIIADQEKFDDLQTEMDLFYMKAENQRTPSSIKIGNYYAILFDKDWLRGKIVDLEGTSATVHFIDFGDDEVIPLSAIFELKEEFCELPSQGVSASLYGLEYCYHDEKLLLTLNELVLGKALVAEVQDRRESDNFISVILYDTSSVEDININEKVLELAAQDLEEPELPASGGICEVYVTNISDSGILTICIEALTSKILKDMLALVKAQAMPSEDNLSIDVNKLYLAKFADESWHRSMPRSFRNAQTDNKGICCQLSDVPAKAELRWCEKTSEKLRSLLPSEQPLLLRVVKNGTVAELPSVNLFRRIDSQNMLVSINETLSMDNSIFVTENNNVQPLKISNDGTKPSVEELACQSLPTLPLPKVGDFFDVRVTYAANPYNMAVQSFEHVAKLDLLMGEMKDYYSNPSNRQSPGAYRKGGFYAYYHDDFDWYRVRIDDISDAFISGTFVDYGDCFITNTNSLIANTNSTQIQPLWPNFRNFPAQSLKAMLTGVQPVNGDWTPLDNVEFQKLVENKDFVSHITAVNLSESKNGSTHLEVNLIDTQDDEVDVYIDKTLIEKGIAIQKK